uniref:Ribosomal protein L33 n=1 Tax=Faramea multiflora TaxID=58421 RepID=A0A6F8FDX3_9GENT|nr:ribosomal protein L33 [Faramea multiflora]
MAKGKEVRVAAILECNSCVRKSVINRISTGISRHTILRKRAGTIRLID